MKTNQNAQSSTEENEKSRIDNLLTDEILLAVWDKISFPTVYLENENVKLKDWSNYTVEYTEIRIQSYGRLFRHSNGTGGIACSIALRGIIFEFSKGYSNTTQERLDLLALISGLEKIKNSCYLNIFTDSKKNVKAMTFGHVLKWKQNNWRLENGNKVNNHDLWQRLLLLSENHKMVSYSFVHDFNSNNSLYWSIIREEIGFINEQDVIIDEI